MVYTDWFGIALAVMLLVFYFIARYYQSKKVRNG